MSNSLWPCELQHTRLSSPSLSPGICSNSCPLSRWCHPTISSSVAFFFCLQSFPASGPFPVSWLFTSGGQSTGASASASVLPVNIQGWFPLGLNGLISLLFSKSADGVCLVDCAGWGQKLSCLGVSRSCTNWLGIKDWGAENIENRRGWEDS